MTRPRVATKSLAALLIVLVLQGGSGASRAAGTDLRSPVGQQLALLPDLASLHRQVLIGDLARLQAAYPHPRAFRAALAGAWLPDALAGLGTALWQQSYGLDLTNVGRFAAAGFHPAELLAAAGHFQPQHLRATLLRNGYHADGEVLAHGADASIDPTTAGGRLTLSSLDRVVVRDTSLRAGSTSALVRSAAPPLAASLGRAPDLAAAAQALGTTTSVVISSESGSAGRRSRLRTDRGAHGEPVRGRPRRPRPPPNDQDRARLRKPGGRPHRRPRPQHTPTRNRTDRRPAHPVQEHRRRPPRPSRERPCRPDQRHLATARETRELARPPRARRPRHPRPLLLGE